MPTPQHPTPEEPRWLDDRERHAWLDVWSMLVWLPARLDAQLRRDAGLSLPEYHALSQISMAPEGRLQLRDLAAVANMTPSHLSRVIARLERAGWVRRTPAPDDGRVTFATLTDEGWHKVEQSAPGHVAAVRRYVFDPLSPQQAAALGEGAALIAAALDPPGHARA